MSKLIKEGIAEAKTFHGTFQCIDDLCALNDGVEFQNSYKEIYPKELVLKLEYSGFHSTFLALNIIISNGKISTKLYDKRDYFSFIYCSLAKLCSNISSSAFYGTVILRHFVLQNHFLLL